LINRKIGRFLLIVNKRIGKQEGPGIRGLVKRICDRKLRP